MTYYRTVGFQECEYSGYLPLTNHAIPIYFGEEEKHVYLPTIPGTICDQNSYPVPPGCVNNYISDEFLTSAYGAKLGGAAGWTWHTSKLFRYASNYSAQLTETELTVFLNLRPRLDATPWPR